MDVAADKIRFKRNISLMYVLLIGVLVVVAVANTSTTQNSKQ